MKTPLLFIDKPVFGLDIGHSTIKVIQLNKNRQRTSVNGYGTIDFNPNAIVKGELVNIEELARQTFKLFESGMTGKIETKRVAASLPVSFTYSRVVNLPPMEERDLKEA
ncbi:MAG TPA: pilus assembly protein PilM, partial [Candidatus Saccharimonadales bacterium]